MPPPWMTKQGAAADDTPYGSRSPFERSVVRRVRNRSTFLTTAFAQAPLQDLATIVTPSGPRYVQSYAGTPAIDQVKPSPISSSMFLILAISPRSLASTAKDRKSKW